MRARFIQRIEGALTQRFRQGVFDGAAAHAAAEQDQGRVGLHQSSRARVRALTDVGAGRQQLARAGVQRGAGGRDVIYKKDGLARHGLPLAHGERPDDVAAPLLRRSAAGLLLDGPYARQRLGARHAGGLRQLIRQQRRLVVATQALAEPGQRHRHDDVGAQARASRRSQAAASPGTAPASSARRT